MTKPDQKPEDLDMEILVNSVMAAQNACNAATAALKNVLRKRAGVPSGGAPTRDVPPTFMAKATRMVNTDTPEENQNAGQTAARGDGGSDGRERGEGDGPQDQA
jgi:hypothetical protein